MAAPSPNQWAAIAPLLDEALELALDRRAELLASWCGSDAHLRAEVERVLGAVERPEPLLDEPVSELVSPLVERLAREEGCAPGDRLGTYRIERELGRGGMAVVYLAHDTRHDRLVALKVLDRELSFTLGADRFTRETAIAARLNHPNVLPLFDSGLLDPGSGSMLYYAMPFVDGRSLRDRLRERPRLPIATAVSIGCQLADALDHAHQHGVVHRDIKPENVLLAGEHAFLADFGIALALDAVGGDRLTRTGLSLGTPAYMSPEQATAGRLDGRTDLYSLGCVLYEMLGGRPPFSGPDARGVLAQHAAHPVPPLRKLRPDVPLALERVIVRALSKVPDDRFPTGRALADALAAPPGGALILHAGDLLRRHAWLAATLGALTAGILAAVAIRAGPLRHAARAALDPLAVAVAPFRMNATDPSLRYLRDGVVDMLATRLSGTEMLRPVESGRLVRVWRGMTNGSDDLTEPQLMDLDGRVGAGRLVEGEIGGARARLTISSTLRDVVGRRTLARETIEGPADSLTALLDRLAARLLVLAAGEGQSRLASMAGSPLPAVRAYVDGQALDRRGLADSAARRFEAAVRSDSTFSLGALRLAQTSPWPDVSDAAQVTAWRYRDRLSAPDRAALAVTLGPRYPRPSRFRETIQAAEHYVQVAPDQAEAWYLLGRQLLENGPVVGLPETQARAASALARAVAIDSTSVPALRGLAIAATVLGDTVTARRTLALLRQQEDSIQRSDFEPAWFMAATLGDTAALHRVLATDTLAGSLRSGQPGAHGDAMIRLGLHQGLDLRDADGVLDRALRAAATERQRGAIRWNQAMLDQIRGLPTRVPTGLPVIPASSYPANAVLATLFADGDSAGFGAAGAALLREIGSQRSDRCCIPRFAAGEYALATNRLDLAEQAVKDLLTYHGPSALDDSAVTTPISHEYGVILDAQVAALRHDPLASARLGRLDSLLADPVDASWWMPPLGNLIAARLHEERGEQDAALAAIHRRVWGLVCPFFVAYHREEGRLAALRGDTVGAIRAYRRYLALRTAAEPRLQPRVLEVRRALVALEQPIPRSEPLNKK